MTSPETNNSLDNIGFYTLSDLRVQQVNQNSPMWRCELILSDKCNFHCPYCRGIKKDYQGIMPLEEAITIIKYWCSQGLKNIRFSGGEPTLYQGLDSLVILAKKLGVEHIAISTNGTADTNYYRKLCKLGVNDFSISLDACCAVEARKMSGTKKDVLSIISTNIKELSKLTYVSVGIVLTEQNVDEVHKIVTYADSLGVTDIRVISAAQYNHVSNGLSKIPYEILDKHPILKYRVLNFLSDRNVRGLRDTDSSKCALVIDDSAIVGYYHFPCINYLREQGQPIGRVNANMRKERVEWFRKHNSQTDPICKNNCLDVCVDYNNKYRDCHD